KKKLSSMASEPAKCVNHNSHFPNTPLPQKSKPSHGNQNVATKQIDSKIQAYKENTIRAI
ncbi:MAG: hypothetical protein ACOVMR_02870, partial [Flavobacteriales bacterium]